MYRFVCTTMPMTRKPRTKQNSEARRSRAGVRPRTATQKSRLSLRKTKGVSPKASGEESKHEKRSTVDLEMYRPLKKPITVRIDADVLAWFKKDGGHYQTRINSALREFMERETKR